MKILKFLSALVLPITFGCSTKPFITTWQTTMADESITIPTHPDKTYNYTVDWGDGTTTQEIGDATHSYSTPGEYTVKISGTFPHLYFKNSEESNRQKILSVDQWGNIAWESMEYTFYECKNFTIKATDAPNLSDVTNTEYMFYAATSFNEPINHWDVSGITNMQGMFYGAESFNHPLDSWNMSNVTNTSAMFIAAFSFNQPLEAWNVSKVTNMELMFNGAASFNQPLNDWNVGKVTNMQSMFTTARSFNQPLNNWNVSQVTEIQWMFFRASSFDQSLANWNLSNVENMENMFTSVTLSTTNYNATLVGWATKDIPNNIYFGGGDSKYCTTGETAKNTLINTHSWIITDGGKDTDANCQ